MLFPKIFQKVDWNQENSVDFGWLTAKHYANLAHYRGNYAKIAPVTRKKPAKNPQENAPGTIKIPDNLLKHQSGIVIPISCVDLRYSVCG